MLLFNFIFQHVIKGFLLAFFFAATKFFVSGVHVGETTFVTWMVGGFWASLFLKFLEAVEIYQKLKDRNNT